MQYILHSYMLRSRSLRYFYTIAHNCHAVKEEKWELETYFQLLFQNYCRKHLLQNIPITKDAFTFIILKFASKFSISKIKNKQNIALGLMIRPTLHLGLLRFVNITFILTIVHYQLALKPK